MAYALVGAAGAVSQGALGATVTPAWGAGANRTAGNLLVLLIAASGTSVANPGGPAGWTNTNLNGGSTASADVCARIATGADAAPTVANGVANCVVAAMLLEFSGNPSNADTGDQAFGVGTTTTTSPLVALSSGIDALIGELVVYAVSLFYSAAATKTFTPTFNNGQTGNVTSSAAISTRNHYWFDWSTTTSKAAADQVSLAITTTALTSGTGTPVSFPLPRRPSRTIRSQAVARAASRMSVYRRESGILVPRLWTPEGATI